MNELDAIVESARSSFLQAQTPADLENAKALYLGKSGRMTELMKGMAALSVDEKKSRGTFKAFNHIFVMMQPSAQDSVITTSVSIFNTFYKGSQFGYASTQAIILLGIILFLTYAQNKIFGERVFYG